MVFTLGSSNFTISAASGKVMFPWCGQRFLSSGQLATSRAVWRKFAFHLSFQRKDATAVFV